MIWERRFILTGFGGLDNGWIGLIRQSGHKDFFSVKYIVHFQL